MIFIFEFCEWFVVIYFGFIDGGYKGFCNVYMKKMNDVFFDLVVGDGWFKIWEDGYDISIDKWCVDMFIENNGLFFVNLLIGLFVGEYFI